MNDIEKARRLRLIRVADQGEAIQSETPIAPNARENAKPSKRRFGPAPFLTPKSDGFSQHRALPNRMFTTMPRYR